MQFAIHYKNGAAENGLSFRRESTMAPLCYLTFVVKRYAYTLCNKLNFSIEFSNINKCVYDTFLL